MVTGVRLVVDMSVQATRRSARQAVLSVASRVEQEIRAYPRAHAAFYRVITRNARVRDAVGRVRDGVRASPGVVDVVPTDPEVVARRREAAVAARLGLPPGDAR